MLGAVALGARVVEKHFTDNNNRQGPDHKFSMNPFMEKMIDETRMLEMSLGDGNKVIEKNEKDQSLFNEGQSELQKIYTKITRLQIHL